MIFFIDFFCCFLFVCFVVVVVGGGGVIRVKKISLLDIFRRISVMCIISIVKHFPELVLSLVSLLTLRFTLLTQAAPTLL